MGFFGFCGVFWVGLGSLRRVLVPLSPYGHSIRPAGRVSEERANPPKGAASRRRRLGVTEEGPDRRRQRSGGGKGPTLTTSLRSVSSCRVPFHPLTPLTYGSRCSRTKWTVREREWSEDRGARFRRVSSVEGPCERSADRPVSSSHYAPQGLRTEWAGMSVA